jgi:hypothetical protein
MTRILFIDEGSSSTAAQLPSGSVTISAQSQSLADSVMQVLRTSKEPVLLLSSTIRASAAQIEEMSEAPASAALELFANADSISDAQELANSTPDRLVARIAQESSWSMGAMMISAEFAAEVATKVTGKSFAEIATKTIILAIGNQENIESTTLAGDCFFEITLSVNEQAQALRTMINNFNIEEMYPNHNWSQHEGEAAAACYHTLAAMFIRLGDLDSAAECLRLSDQLEDSPRSLALKAFIARERGETLGAVANLVSSLEQYEHRKVQDGSHYLNFNPQDIEVINQKLSAGLDALNKRNNQQAMEFFAEAVYNFDSFYADNGLGKRQ